MQVVKGKQYVSLLLKALALPFFFLLTSYLLMIIFSTIYFSNEYDKIVKNNPQYTTTQINQVYDEAITTEKFQVSFDKYLEKQNLIIVLITTIIFLPIFLKTYKKYKPTKTKLNVKNILFLITIGITFALALNIIIYYFDQIFNLTNRYEAVKISIVSLISTGIIGPILEEYLFRGILYNKLKTFNKQKTAVILTSIIFAIIHLEITQMIYTFIFSIILIKLYEHFKTLKAPIIVHCSANTIVALTVSNIISFNLIANLFILIVCSIIFIFLTTKIKSLH